MHLPGTTIEISGFKKSMVPKILANIFAGGGVILSQVCTITGLEPHIIQNWVKRKFVSPPKSRLYSEEHLCRIIMINMLKNTMQIDKIVALLDYVCDADSEIGNATLYELCVEMMAVFSEKSFSAGELRNAVRTFGYESSAVKPRDKKRVSEVLTVMFYANVASNFHKISEELYLELCSEHNL